VDFLASVYAFIEAKILPSGHGG